MASAEAQIQDLEDCLSETPKGPTVMTARSPTNPHDELWHTSELFQAMTETFENELHERMEQLLEMMMA